MAHEDFDVTLRKLTVRDDRLVEGVLGTERENVAASRLDAKTHALVQMAALVVLDAAPRSYTRAAETALFVGATREEIVGTLIGAMPVVGSARIVSAGTKLGLGLGYDVEAALEGEVRSWAEGSTR